MGFFDMFKRRDGDSRHISMPSKPKSHAGVGVNLLETMEEPEVPKPFTERNEPVIIKKFIPRSTDKPEEIHVDKTHLEAAPPQSEPVFKEPIHTEKAHEEDTIFELPDFKEEDLKIDVPDDITKQEPLPYHEQSVPVEQVYEEESEEELQDLPRFETSRIVDMDTIKDELRPPTKPIKVDVKKPEAKPTPKKIEIFIEKNSYLNSLTREEEVISEVKHINQDLNKIMKYSGTEKKIQSDILDMATEIKDKLLAMDIKLFEEG